ncbi:DUF4058 family protein [Candidatus Entotheonella palauensis]|uniref:DUF4058 domain-containing protein n=1 Tax=Candidatus Entotheonella gemina TaxID=1429439 RepID=W4LX05_9BACT|nr:DUF4058 family protein [Candidatus Entotheonella palauensis]ETX02644.1 MAG: hypothetical protein ETSY2_35130 [Candidatus Entotheonella gemina]
MPSPFPGMDPYLEHPALWPGVHQRFITYLGDTLNAVLPPHYVADIGERLYVVEPAHTIYPDVVVHEQPPVRSHAPLKSPATSTAVSSDPPWVLTIEPVEMREVFIHIVSVADASRVITAIEVLSPSNKAGGSPGKELYQSKQRELLASQTHLIEIDLLRRGSHTVAPPRVYLAQQGTWDYLVCLHRGGEGQRYEVWARGLRERLPRIRVPLSEGDRDLVVDLQTILTRCYDEGAYARRLNYAEEPQPPLRASDIEWAHELLRAQGLRG